MKRQPQKMTQKDSCKRKGPKRIPKRKTQNIVQKYSLKSSILFYAAIEALKLAE